MLFVLSFLPILLLIILSLLRNVKEAVFVVFAVTTGLFFYWGPGLAHYAGTLVISGFTTLNILMIVFGAAFLFNIMQKNGLIDRISSSVAELHPANEVRFFLLALGLTGFFEGVAGFGTPGAIVPLLLIALGYNAVLSVAVVLLFNGLFAIFGAVGTPLTIGIQLPLQLPEGLMLEIGIISAGISVMVVFFWLFYVFGMFKNHGIKLLHKKLIVWLYVLFIIPFCLFAWLVPELATVLGSLIMLMLSVLLLKQKGTKFQFRPWLPYLFLALLLLLPRLFMPLNSLLGWEIIFADLFQTGMTAGFRPLQTPMVPFLIIGSGVAFWYRNKDLGVNVPLEKTGRVLIVLFPSIVIAQLMIHSGLENPSMVAHIAQALAATGQVYPLISPFMGIIGTFITGSTTISNIVFAPSQLETAKAIDLPAGVILALQHAGAALGNAVSLFNIIAAAAIANLHNYKEVLKKTLVPVMLGGLILGLLGILLVFVGN
jgi:lactate permease